VLAKCFFNFTRRLAQIEIAEKRRLLAIGPSFSAKICVCIIQRTSAGKK